MTNKQTPAPAATAVQCPACGTSCHWRGSHVRCKSAACGWHIDTTVTPLPPATPEAAGEKAKVPAAPTQIPPHILLVPNLAGGLVVERHRGKDCQHHVRIRWDGSVEWTEFSGNKVLSITPEKGRHTLAVLLAERDEQHSVDEQPPAPSATPAGELADVDSRED